MAAAATAAAVSREVKLLGAWASPYVLRSMIALGLKGVGYEYIQETLSDGKSELLLKSNPVYKKVPVLIHDERLICESRIIVEYIDDVWAKIGPAILPSDPFDRATSRFWAVYIDEKWQPAFRKTVMSPTEEEKTESRELVHSGLQLLESAFEKCSKGKGFFGGDTIGYLDIVLGSTLGWLKATEKFTGEKFLDEEKTPLLVGWAARFCSDAVVKDVMPATEELVKYGEKVLAKYMADLPAN